MTFFNIFNRKKRQETKKPIIIADHREKNSLVIAELIAQGIEVQFEQLAIADYLASDVAIERKTASDLAASIVNKRIFSQLEGMQHYPKRLLIIEGLATLDNQMIHENALRGFLLSVALDYQIPLIQTTSEQDTATYLALLAKKSKSSPSSLRPSRSELSESEQLEFILEGFPSIGPVTASKLLAHFKSIQNLGNATLEEIQKIIGKKADHIYRFIRLHYRPEREKQ